MKTGYETGVGNAITIEGEQDENICRSCQRTGHKTTRSQRCPFNAKFKGSLHEDSMAQDLLDTLSWEDDDCQFVKQLMEHERDIARSHVL